MSTPTTPREHTLSIDPETGMPELDGIGYTDLTWDEHRILEELLIDAYGPRPVRLDLPVDLEDPPF